MLNIIYFSYSILKILDDQNLLSIPNIRITIPSLLVYNFNEPLPN